MRYIQVSSDKSLGKYEVKVGKEIRFVNTIEEALEFLKFKKISLVPVRGEGDQSEAVLNGKHYSKRVRVHSESIPMQSISTEIEQALREGIEEE